MKMDLNFSRDKYRGNILYYGIKFLEKDLCIELCHKEYGVFYIPVNLDQSWFKHISLDEKFETYKEMIKAVS